MFTKVQPVAGVKEEESKIPCRQSSGLLTNKLWWEFIIQTTLFFKTLATVSACER